MGFGGIWAMELGRNWFWWDLGHTGEKNGICWDLGGGIGEKWDLVGFGSWNWGDKWDLVRFELWNWDQNGIWVINWGEKWDLVGFGLWNWGEKWDLLGFEL